MQFQELGLKFAALLTVYFLTLFGGLILYSLGRGFHIVFFGKILLHTKPLCTFWLVPPAGINQWTGVLIRNTMVPFLDNFPDYFSQLIRIIVLGVNLMRAGFKLRFQGFTLFFLLLGIIPLFFEAIIVGLFSRALFDMPVEWNLAMGCMMCSAGTAVIIPSMVNMQRKGFGSDKRINQMMLVSTTIDNVISNMLFQICKGEILNDYFANQGINDSLPRYPQVILRVFFSILIGFGIGAFFGIIAFVFKYIGNKRVRNWAQFLFCLALIIGIPLGSEFLKFPDCKYIALILTAYIMGRIYEDDLPYQMFDDLWFYSTPAIFGTMGAEMNLRLVQAKQIWRGIIIVIASLISRTLISFLCALPFKKKFTMKEMIFIGYSQTPKGTIHAWFGYDFYNIIKNHLNIDSTSFQYAQNILATAMMAVIITQPIMGMTINNTGPKMLSKDQSTIQVANQDIIHKPKLDDEINELTVKDKDMMTQRAETEQALECKAYIFVDKNNINEDYDDGNNKYTTETPKSEKQDIIRVDSNQELNIKTNGNSKIQSV